MTTNQLFAITHNIRLESVEKFQKLGRLYGEYRTNELNGEEIKSSTKTRSKCENSAIWARMANTVAESMEAFVKLWGFDHLDFGAGLYPTIQETKSDTTKTIIFVF